ncbi:MAG: glutamine synthetase family protein [Saccharolobus sp.]|uniref:glutamine synthetase family protein n=1 Tax=Saccharolobus sp. TaxID=2100761 RepID=UPI0028CEAE44|nr:glutamine synthetase family protein [Saccharolobus sp.]MDT7860710.1 glutamine synthetase family protein [Saccharolobus sp.]
MSKEDVFDILKSGKIDYVRVEFVDLLGNTKGRSLRRAEFESIISDNKGVDYPESLVLMDYKDRPIKTKYEDVIALPDLTTFVVIPYLERTARVLSFIVQPDGSSYPYCSRTVLTKAISKLGELGYSLEVSFEPTFYLLNSSLNPADFTKAFSLEGLLEQQNFLKSLIKYLEEIDIQVETINKHYGPGQYEVKLTPKSAMEAADSLISSREIIRDTARIHNLTATFMPKPFKDFPSSSMDITLSLKSTNGKDVMYDPNDPKGIGLSKVAYNFISGIIEHLSTILSIAAPTINSYKRFKEIVTPNMPGIGTERHYIVRIPSYYKNNHYVEFRLADPLANPYLLLATIIYAGIDGIERNLMVNINEYYGILPQTLKESLNKLENDTYIKYNLGQDLISSYINIKNIEIEEYESQITDWEREYYLKAGW